MSTETTAKLEQAAKEFLNLPPSMRDILLAGVMIGKEMSQASNEGVNSSGQSVKEMQTA